jgi:hypothetical protein
LHHLMFNALSRGPRGRVCLTIYASFIIQGNTTPVVLNGLTEIERLDMVRFEVFQPEQEVALFLRYCCLRKSCLDGSGLNL